MAALTFSDVQAVLGSNSGETAWVQQEFENVNLSDTRLNRRLITTAESLAKSPLSSINEACDDWAQTQGAYRFFDNDKVTPAKILEHHRQETSKRMAAHDKVLVLQDTVFYSYGHHPNTTGLGPIGKDKENGGSRGLTMHHAIACTITGVPLGITSQSIFARKEVSGETTAEKVMRAKYAPIEEKESFKWLVSLRDTMDMAPKSTKIVTVADRESDIFEFITEAKELGSHFVLRAKWDRQLISEESAGFESMMEALNAAPVAGATSIKVLSRGGTPPRTATVEIKFVQVTVRPPDRHGRSKLSASTEPVMLNVISTTEINPPVGVSPLSWSLITDLPVRTFNEALEKVNWYKQRWMIEIWHKVMKSGCKVEDCLLETGDRLKRYLAVISVIAYRLMRITYLARTTPDDPCTEVLSDIEWQALHVRMNKTRPSGAPPSLKDAVRLIGRLGGHLGRKSDGEPGVTVLWRGWQRLMEDVVMWQASKSILHKD